MKYLFKAIAIALIAGSLVIWALLKLFYYWVLYPVYTLKLSQQSKGWLAQDYRDFLCEVKDWWTEEPIFYPGWREGLTRAQQEKKIGSHYASFLAYCKEQGSYDPK